MNKDFNFIVKITTSCPGNCKCCINRQKNFKTKNINNSFFDLEIFEKICIGLKKLGGSYICLSGGEPTIVPNIDDYIQIAHNNNLAVRLNTNGWGITSDKMKKWLSLGLDQVVLSVYGLDKETIRKTRGNPVLYDRSMNAAKILSKFKEKHNFIFIIQTIIMKDNYKQISEIFKFAIENNADLFWPSYLEDAINLEKIRMDKTDILDFKNNVIPLMKNIVNNNKKLNKKILLESLNKYYKDDFDNYVYHQNNCNCSWVGKHFTFYPNGKIDPCPGHEYFNSEYQEEVDYTYIEKFITFDNLVKNSGICFEYCKYCPQGIHQELCLRKKIFHEHSKKEEIV